MSTQQLIMSATGETVEFGRMIQATVGPHTGTWWRLDGLTHNGREHIVRVSRCVRGGRMRRIAAFPLHVFGLMINEVRSIVRRACRTAEHKTLDYMLAGFFALVPLAFFEQYHGAEHITELVRLLLGG